jgi:hypothetical protein
LNTYSEKQANTGFNRTAVELALLAMPQASRDDDKRIREILHYGSRKEPFQKNVFFALDERKKYISDREGYMNIVKQKYFKNLQEDLFSRVDNISNSYELRVEDAAKVLMFGVLAPSKYEYIETLRTLQILYRIESLLKRSKILKAVMKLFLNIFGIRDKI